MIRTSSAAAYRDLTDSGKRDQNSTAIVKAVTKRPVTGFTRRELEEKTGLRPNQISGRVCELIDQKRLKEGRMRKCDVTGNLVNVVFLGEALND